MERYGNVCVSYFEACRQALEEPIEVDRPIDVYFQRVEDAIQFSQYGKTPFAPGTNCAYGLSCRQQDRFILPGIKGMAQ